MFTDAQRLLYYQSRGLSAVVIREIEEMRTNSPSRRLSQRGMKNILVDSPSLKNLGRRALESYTVEYLFALEIELFGVCHEYYVQVEPKNIVRYGRTSTVHIDFMLFEPDGIRLIECKPSEDLLKLASKRPDEWVRLDTGWTRPAVDAWAAEHGMSYAIWCPPEPHGIYQANLLALYSFLSSESDKVAGTEGRSKIRKALETRPLSLGGLPEHVPGVSVKHALVALAMGEIYGPLRSVPIDEPDRFMLYASRERSDQCDSELLARLRDGLAQPDVASQLLRARPADYLHAVSRLERIRRMLSGEEPITRRYAPLVRQVQEASSKGEGELEACLTHYERAGRRAGQLTADQEAALNWVIARYRSDPLLRSKLQAHDALRIHCEEKGLRAPSRTTFLLRLRAKSPLRRAYTEGGYRAFHAAEEAVDPGVRTMRCLVPKLMVHVDSTKFDLRCSPDFLASLGFDCPTLYVAMDSATGMPLGRAVMFGAACRNALAVLIRDIFHRQGFLPRYWIVDKGSEYIGDFFAGFCEYAGATHIQAPPGSPRKNSLAENALGRINAELAHRFLGSTAPDRQGRSVTSRQKSQSTACMAYATVVQHLDQYLFSDMVDVRHGVNRLSPREKNDQMGELFGHLGLVDVKSVDDFLIATSVPIARDIKVDPSRGIRYLQRRYTSADLLREIRSQRPVEMRLDCVDPHRMYVKFCRRWVLANTAESLRVVGRDDLSKLFESLTDEATRSGNTRLRDKIRISRQARTEEANRTAGSTRHLEHLAKEPKDEVTTAPTRVAMWSQSGASADPFPTEDA
ncbi:integrase catalytic domain-containing protein [Dyella subtropica]|uniref:integrase catalytic domain-containing protein n=1 Tax=Dyella subtropica TaxID=2992127 RepID=UPI002253F0F5|nr:transposase family protein [Dyella subtropica]